MTEVIIIVLRGDDPGFEPPLEYQPKRRREGTAWAQVEVRARKLKALEAMRDFHNRVKGRDAQLYEPRQIEGWYYARLEFHMNSSEGNAESDVIPELNRGAEANKHVVWWDLNTLVVGWSPR